MNSNSRRAQARVARLSETQAREASWALWLLAGFGSAALLTALSLVH